MKIEGLVQSYEEATRNFLNAANQLRPEDLDKGPEGEWTPRMVVHHLAHADAYCLTRIIQVLSEPGTPIRSFSEEALAGSEILAYRSAPIEPALALFSATRSETARLLHNASEADLARTCQHSEYGEISLEAMIGHYTSHPVGHIQQILDAISA
jgi:DinB superfamily